MDDFKFDDEKDVLKKELNDFYTSPPDDIITFGVSYLDDALGGIEPMDCVVVSSTTGAGKTELAVQIASNAAQAGKRVAFYALEADKNEIFHRLIYKRIIKIKKEQNDNAGFFDYQDYYTKRKKDLWGIYFQQASKEILSETEKLNVFYPFENIDREFTQASVEAELLCRSQDTDLFILDHLHFVQIDGPDYLKQMDQLMRTIGKLVKYLKKPVILIAQLRKATDYNRPLLPTVDDIFGASQIKNTATKIILFGRDPNDSQRGGVLINCAKNRRRGEVMYFTAKLSYSYLTNQYSDKYFIGRLMKGGKEFELMDKKDWPRWATNAAIPTIDAITSKHIL